MNETSLHRVREFAAAVILIMSRIPRPVHSAEAPATEDGGDIFDASILRASAEQLPADIRPAMDQVLRLCDHILERQDENAALALVARMHMLRELVVATGLPLAELAPEAAARIKRAHLAVVDDGFAADQAEVAEGTAIDGRAWLDNLRTVVTLYLARIEQSSAGGAQAATDAVEPSAPANRRPPADERWLQPPWWHRARLAPVGAAAVAIATLAFAVWLPGPTPSGATGAEATPLAVSDQEFAVCESTGEASAEGMGPVSLPAPQTGADAPAVRKMRRKASDTFVEFDTLIVTEDDQPVYEVTVTKLPRPEQAAQDGNWMVSPAVAPALRRRTIDEDMLNKLEIQIGVKDRFFLIVGAEE